eukprot:TRINITY_DN27705_c0_g1_i1.p1 TRINITY_DN27705_c0_g1~~TRINITY_DN27705_c0_g1_i1.p1  ORF type:complete len:210 (+),score=34.42 TRINITY_DN27705_c0_g1_i1:146-775(+)
MLSAGAVGGPGILDQRKFYDHVAGHPKPIAQKIGRAVARPGLKTNTDVGPGQYRTERIFAENEEEFSVALSSTFQVKLEPRMTKDGIMKGNVLARKSHLGPGQYERPQTDTTKNKQPAFSQRRGTEFPEALRLRKGKEHILGPAHYALPPSDFDAKNVTKNGWAGSQQFKKSATLPELHKAKRKCEWKNEWSRMFSKTVRVPDEFQRYH